MAHPENEPTRERALAQLRDASRGTRLQKLLAEAGLGSRRACEAMLEEGRVSVNGVTVEVLPAWADPAQDRITVDGSPVDAPSAHRVYVMLHKPTRTVTTNADPAGRRTVADLVQHPAGVRLYPVGRLDYDTTGLVLLTNDGVLANKLTHPRYGVHKTYRATVRGLLTEDVVAELERGVYLAERREGRTTGGAGRAAAVRMRIAHLDRAGDRTILELALEEGRNRQVRRMFAKLGHPVRRLMRVAMGPVRLKGLAQGEWRALTRDEVRQLRRATDGTGPVAPERPPGKPKRPQQGNRPRGGRGGSHGGGQGGRPRGGSTRRSQGPPAGGARGGRQSPGRGRSRG